MSGLFFAIVAHHSQWCIFIYNNFNIYIYIPSFIFLADRAKAIKTKAVINESPTDKLIRELREENKKLMDQLKKGGGVGVGGGVGRVYLEKNHFVDIG